MAHLKIALAQFIFVLALIALVLSQVQGASAQTGFPPEWAMLTHIAQHVNSGVDAPFDGREDFVLLLPFEYGFNGRGACVEYTERPSIEQVYYSVQTVEMGLIDPDTILWEDGSCLHLPGSNGLTQEAIDALRRSLAN